MSVPARAANDTKELPQTFLGLANEAYQESKQNRIMYAQLAREAGLTNQEIGDIYGITEAAVRMMLKRAAN